MDLELSDPNILTLVFNTVCDGFEFSIPGNVFNTLNRPHETPNLQRVCYKLVLEFKI